MPVGIITITDTADGKIDMQVDFGEVYEATSQAHQMVHVLAESVLKNANDFKQIEDTAPEANIEPSKIITPDNI